MLFWLFFIVWVPISTHSSAIFHPNTHMIFYCPLSAYSGFHFLCSKLWTVADASSFALKLCRMLEKSVVVLCPPPQFQKNQKRKLVSSQTRSLHFPHLRGQLWGVTSQIHSFLSFFWHGGLRGWGNNSVLLGWVYSRVSLSVWPLAVVRLAFTDKIWLAGTKDASLSLLIAFSVTNDSRTSEIWRRKNLYCCAYTKLVCYAIARFLAPWWKFACRTRLYPIFPKHFVLFVWFYLEWLL